MLTSCVPFVPHLNLPDSQPSSGTWKSAHFKKYNFEAEGIYPNGGALLPLLKVREEMRNIFLEMGLVNTSSATPCLIDRSFSPPALPRCQPLRSSSQVSGVSMRSLYHDRILRTHVVQARCTVSR